LVPHQVSPSLGNPIIPPFSRSRAPSVPIVARVGHIDRRIETTHAGYQSEIIPLLASPTYPRATQHRRRLSPRLPPRDSGHGEVVSNEVLGVPSPLRVLRGPSSLLNMPSGPKTLLEISPPICYRKRMFSIGANCAHALRPARGLLRRSLAYRNARAHRYMVREEPPSRPHLRNLHLRRRLVQHPPLPHGATCDATDRCNHLSVSTLPIFATPQDDATNKRYVALLHSQESPQIWKIAIPLTNIQYGCTGQDATHFPVQRIGRD